MAFTLVGEGLLPDRGLRGVRRLGPASARSTWRRPGVGPQDGFTELQGFARDPPRPRWGDYGAAAPDGNDIWIASEYIGQRCTLATYQADPTCGQTRAPLINWGTRISAVNP